MDKKSIWENDKNTLIIYRGNKMFDYERDILDCSFTLENLAFETERCFVLIDLEWLGDTIDFHIHDKKTLEYIGHVGIQDGNSGRANNVYYALHKQHQKQGYMTEIIPKFLDYTFNGLKLDGITAWCSHYNKGSNKILSRHMIASDWGIKWEYGRDGHYYNLNKNEYKNLTKN